ncbi:MAG: ribulose-phosphate 3-epimerase [Clostridiales bacterium]|nr:ribulose-phosphate 3-epimerase [Clostridiales bacterium]
MKVAPSILTCDFAHLAEEIKKMEMSGADMLHLDVMDGVFVPNLSFGPPVIEKIRAVTELPLDVHLMMEQPAPLLDAFAAAGADSLNLHLECASPLKPALEKIRALGRRSALTLKPGTPAEAVFPYLELIDMVLVMTVEPGFGGQQFMADMLPKAAALRAEIDRRRLPVVLQVDGGINRCTAPLAAKAGADIAVAGSALLTDPDPRDFVDSLHALG